MTVFRRFAAAAALWAVPLAAAAVPITGGVTTATFSFITPLVANGGSFLTTGTLAPVAGSEVDGFARSYTAPITGGEFNGPGDFVIEHAGAGLVLDIPDLATLSISDFVLDTSVPTVFADVVLDGSSQGVVDLLDALGASIEVMGFSFTISANDDFLGGVADGVIDEGETLVDGVTDPVVDDGPDVTPIPLPGAGFMLLGAVGILMLSRRRS